MYLFIMSMYRQHVLTAAQVWAQADKGAITETASRAVREHLQVDKLKSAAAKTISRCTRAAAMAERQERILQYA